MILTGCLRLYAKQYHAKLGGLAALTQAGNFELMIQHSEVIGGGQAL
jgi:hypothetical protein